MRFENKNILKLLPVVKAGLGITFTIKKTNKTAEGIKRLTQAEVESGSQITFIDPKSRLNLDLKSLRFKN